MDFTQIERYLIYSEGKCGLFELESRLYDEAKRTHESGCRFKFETSFGLYLKLRKIETAQEFNDIYYKIKKEDEEYFKAKGEMAKAHDDTDDKKEKDSDDGSDDYDARVDAMAEKVVNMIKTIIDSMEEEQVEV